MTQTTMPQVDSCGDARRPKSLRNWRGRRLEEDIKAIITLTRKENFLVHEYEGRLTDDECQLSERIYLTYDIHRPNQFKQI